MKRSVTSRTVEVIAEILYVFIKNRKIYKKVRRDLFGQEFVKKFQSF